MDRRKKRGKEKGQKRKQKGGMVKRKEKIVCPSAA